MDMVSFFGAGLIALTLCVFFILMAKPLARHIGLVDKPAGRKQHEGAIPLIGGLVIIPVYLGMLFFFPDYHDLPLLKFVPAILTLLAVGALDDRMHIHPWVRFGIQVVVALYSVIIFENLNINLGNLFGFGNVGLGWFKYIFFATCLVLLMNAINMIDGARDVIWLNKTYGDYKGNKMNEMWDMISTLPKERWEAISDRKGEQDQRQHQQQAQPQQQAQQNPQQAPRQQEGTRTRSQGLEVGVDTSKVSRNFQELKSLGVSVP